MKLNARYITHEGVDTYEYLSADTHTGQEYWKYVFSEARKKAESIRNTSGGWVSLSAKMIQGDYLGWKIHFVIRIYGGRTRYDSASIRALKSFLRELLYHTERYQVGYLNGIKK